MRRIFAILCALCGDSVVIVLAHVWMHASVSSCCTLHVCRTYLLVAFGAHFGCTDSVFAPLTHRTDCTSLPKSVGPRPLAHRTVTLPSLPSARRRPLCAALMAVLSALAWLQRSGRPVRSRSYTEVEVLSSIIAAAIHDYEHGGLNNAFHIATR